MCSLFNGSEVVYGVVVIVHNYHHFPKCTNCMLLKMSIQAIVIDHQSLIGHNRYKL